MDCTFENMDSHPIAIQHIWLKVLVEKSLFENCTDSGEGGGIYVNYAEKFVLDKVCANRCLSNTSGHFFFLDFINSSVNLTSVIYCGGVQDDLTADSTTLSINGNLGYIKYLNCSFNKAKYASALKFSVTRSYSLNFSTINSNSFSKHTIDIFNDVIKITSCNILNNHGDYVFSINSDLIIRDSSIYDNDVTMVFFGNLGEIQSNVYLFNTYIDSASSEGIGMIRFRDQVLIKNSVNLERKLSCGIDPVPMTAPKKLEHIINAYKK